MKKIAYLALISILFLLPACAFKYDLTGKTRKEGNLLSDKKIARIRVGMSKQEVAGIMGDPLIAETFRLSRWDYVHTVQKANKPIYIKTVILYFKGDRLARVEKHHSHLGRDFWSIPSLKEMIFGKYNA